MSLVAIRKRYGVPAIRGAKVKFEGRLATITSASGHHLNLRFGNGSKPTGPFHPLWHIDYMDGIDHGARYDERMRAFNRALSANRSSRTYPTFSQASPEAARGTCQSPKPNPDPTSDQQRGGMK